MKHKGAKMEYGHQRMKDLMRTYDEYIAKCDYIRMPDVYETISKMPAPRFYVSDTRSAYIVRKLMRGEDVLKGMWGLRAEMFREIYTRVLKLKEQKPKTSIMELCRMVIDQEAPKFYLTPQTIQIMVCTARKEWIKEKRRKLKIL